MVDNKIKVVWICSFSNQEMRNKLQIKAHSVIEKLLYRILHRTDYNENDSAIWNTNAIREFEKFDDIELHVICAKRGLRNSEQRFCLRGINYYFIREENSNLYRKIIRQLFSKNNSDFKKNRAAFAKLIAEIQPDLVHVIGAENPYYSLALLDVPDSIPTLIQLQALLDRLVDKTRESDEKISFKYKGELERQIIKKANYVGTSVKEFADYIKAHIDSNAVILNTSLAMANEICINNTKKEFDFVYFSANINKAGNEVIESFIRAYKQNPTITLDVIGGYNQQFKDILVEKLKEVGAEGNVTFEGLLPTHDDVLNQIRKSRIALIPLKMDFVPNTIHEAICNCLPVITTITEGTPTLNIRRESVLLSKQGDFDLMASNALKVLSDQNLADKLVANAILTEKEYDSNEDRMKKWRLAYYACFENFYNNKPMPSDILMYTTE